MRINERALGLSVGLLWGVTVFLTTLYLYVINGGDTMYRLRQFYIGYSVTPAGAVIGLVYGLIDGFIGGWILAKLYNFFAKE